MPLELKGNPVTPDGKYICASGPPLTNFEDIELDESMTDNSGCTSPVCSMIPTTLVKIDTLQNISIALNALGPLAEDVSVLFISVDPKRDTPEVLKTYTDAFHPPVVGLTGTYDQLSAVTSGFRTTFGYTLASDDGQDRPLNKAEHEALPETASYFPYHGSQVYLIGKNDELLDIIGYGSRPRVIAKKLRTYLD